MCDLLEKMGIKKTRQRTQIIAALEKADKPCSAEELYRQCEDMSLSTVYRNLERLAALGAVELLTGDARQRYYQLASAPHGHYAVCLGCHHKFPLASCPVHNLDLADFTVTGHKVEIYGYCGSCRGRS